MENIKGYIAESEARDWANDVKKESSGVPYAAPHWLDL